MLKDIQSHDFSHLEKDIETACKAEQSHKMTIFTQNDNLEQF